MTRNELAAESDELEASEAAKHFGNRSTRLIIEADGAIVRFFPMSEDDNGEPVAARRVLVEKGGDSDLGREYNIPLDRERDVYEIRNDLILG